MVKVKVFSWNTVSKDEWMYQTSEKECTYIAYRLEQLPDFTAHRFEYLCKENDDRVMEIAKKQMQMLRQLHNLGNDWTISMRILKKICGCLCILFSDMLVRKNFLINR